MLERHTGERIRFGADFNGNAAALLAEAKPRNKCNLGRMSA